MPTNDASVTIELADLQAQVVGQRQRTAEDVAAGEQDGAARGGRHRGHRGVIARAQALAKKLGKPCALLTFEPHPADVFAGRPVIFRLTPPQAKAAQAAEAVGAKDQGLAELRAMVEERDKAAQARIAELNAASDCFAMMRSCMSNRRCILSISTF